MKRAEFLKVMTTVAAGVVVGCGDDTSGTGGSGTTGGIGGSGGTGMTGGTGGTSTTGGMGGSGATGGTPAGGSGGVGGSTMECGADVDAQITCRHDHSLIVTAADISAGVDKTYDIQGTNQTHGHDVVVTAAMFAQLVAGETVEIAVPSQFQPHTVYISCESGIDPHALDDMQCN